MESAENEIQRAVYTLNNITIKYYLKISVNKTKAMAMRGMMNMRTKILINNHVTIQANNNYDKKHQRFRKKNDKFN
jgi:hypothetical protein